MTNAVSANTNSISPINGLDVVNAVNGFYSSAFQHTVWLLGILIGLLGIVVPTAYYILQNRQLAFKEKQLAENLESKTKQLGEVLRAEIQEHLKTENQKVEQKFIDLEKRIEHSISKSQGRIFHLQGNFEFSNGRLTNALFSFQRAIERYLTCSEFNLVQQNIRFAYEVILPRMSKQDFKDYNVDEFEKVLQKVGAAECNGLLEKDISEVRKALSAAQNRDKK